MAVGKIYFALVDDGEVFNGTVHNREDEEVYRLTISQSEGDFASAEVELKNPSQGLLNPARKKRVFISYQDGASVNLLFSGRIVGFPSDLSTETIMVEYIAQPSDWEQVQDAFIQTLKVSPYYNELFIADDRRDNPSEILQARSSLLYWDRATNQISLSDIVEGSQTVDLGKNVIYDTVRSEIADPPLNKVNVIVEAQWEQFGIGEVDAGLAIKEQFTNTAIATPEINTLTPLSFEDAWRGVRIPNGYSVLESKLTPVANGFGLTNTDLRSGIITVNATDFPRRSGNTTGTREVSVPRVWYNGTLNLQAVYEQKRREIFATSLEASVQEFSLRGNKFEDIVIRLQSPSSPTQGSVFNPKKPSFYYDKALGEITDLGADVIEHALLRAAARLKYANRVIETRFETDLDLSIGITTDHNVRFESDQLPGGSILGKVVSYTLSIDGDSGQAVSKITIQSVIGNGENSLIGGDWQIDGNTLAIPSNTFPSSAKISENLVAYYDSTNQLLKTYSWDGTDWTQVGNSLSFPASSSSMTGLGGNEVAFIDSSNDELRTYSWDGTNWTQVGNSLPVGLVPYTDITLLNEVSKTIAFATSNGQLQTYSWDGTDWIQVGNTLAVASGTPALGTLTSTTISYYNDGDNLLRTYSWDGTDWTQLGNSLLISGAIIPQATALNGNDIAFIESDADNLQTYRWDGTDWMPIGSSLNISHPGIQSIIEIGNEHIAYFSDDSLATYQFNPPMAGVEVGSQQYVNEFGTSPMTSSIFYGLDGVPLIDEPIDVEQMEADNQYLIDAVNVDNDGESQKNGFLNEDILIGSGRPDTFLTNNPTEVQVDLKTMNPQAEISSEVLITTTKLTLPRQVDLEA